MGKDIGKSRVEKGKETLMIQERNGVIQQSLSQGMKEEFSFNLLGILIPVVIILIIGAVVPAVFWGAWYVVKGSIPGPKLFGISRFWLDTISGPLYLLILVSYVLIVIDGYKKFSEKLSCYHFSFWDFMSEFCWLRAIGFFLVGTFAVSIFLSFAVGLAACVALALLIGICCGAWKLFQIISPGASCDDMDDD